MALKLPTCPEHGVKMNRFLDHGWVRCPGAEYANDNGKIVRNRCKHTKYIRKLDMEGK